MIETKKSRPVGGIWKVGLVVAALLSWAPTDLIAQSPTGREQLVRIDTLEVEGNVRLDADVIVGVSGIQPGSLNSWVDIQRAIKALWASGEYADIQVKLDEDEASGTNTLIFQVVERDIVRLIRITGLESISEAEVVEAAGLRNGRPLSQNSLMRAQGFIREELRRKGVPFARIEQRRQPVPGEDEGRIDLVLEVDEGQRVTIAEVNFFGNENLSDEELYGAMATKPEGFFWFQGGDYDDIDFELDLLESLPRRYTHAGFLDFRVARDTLIVDPNTGKARIEVYLDEGPQYRLSGFEIGGNDAYDTEQLERFYRTESGGFLSAFGFGGGEAEREGRVFDLVAFEQAAQSVKEFYSNEGYLYATVEPFWQRIPAEGDAEHTVEAGWRITEHNQAYVNRVLIEGNDFTYDRVIREKVFLLPGDVYSQSRLLQSYQNIQSLGFFETPMAPPDIRPNQDGDVDIVFSVDEKQTGSVNFGTAVGGGVGLSGFLGYDQPNLFGQAKAGSIRWDFGRFINSFTLSMTDPALLQSTVSGSLSLFNSTDRFFQFSTGRRRRIGFTTRFGVPFPGSLRTRVFLGYSLSKTSYSLFNNVDDTSLFGIPDGTLSSLSVGITRRTLNHPLFPTSGSLQTWNTELNGGLLGGAAAFVKHTAEAKWVVPVGGLGGDGATPGGVQFALGLSLKGGALFGDATRFPFESFWMGGVQFGESLRGYDETSVTPRGFFPERVGTIRQIDRLGNAYFTATAEYKVVISGNIGLSTFFDAGNLWRGPEDIDTSNLFRGAGFGVQLVTPFGPIGLDYAYGFDKPEPGWQLHFRMGPNF